jgi:hypothetical protein
MRDLNRGPMRSIGTAYEPIQSAILTISRGCIVAVYGPDRPPGVNRLSAVSTRVPSYYGGHWQGIV